MKVTPEDARMPFVLLLLAFLLYVQESWATPIFDFTPGEAALATVAGVGAFVVLAGAISAAARIALGKTPYRRYEILKRFTRFRRWHFLGIASFFVASLYVLGWGWALESLFADAKVPFIKPFALVPFLVAMILSWALYYDVDHDAHRLLWSADDTKFATRWAYLALNVRHNMILLLPPLILMTAQELLQFLFPELRRREEFPVIAVGLMAALLAASIIGIPWFLRLFLGLRPLPPGELRDQLSATANRLGFRFADILVWDTGGSQANAMVTGLLPINRYIILTDRIIQELTPDEIEGVFGHEVGHVKHHHMGLYTVFLLLSLMLLGALWSFGLEIGRAYWGTEWPTLFALIETHQEFFLVAVIAYIFLVFGVLSRNCERQADLFGCNVSSRDAFIRALEKVADINGIRREKRSIFTAWQHWTIGQRVAFLRSLDADPALEQRVQRRIGILKWSLTLGLAAGCVVLLSSNPWNWLKYL